MRPLIMLFLCSLTSFGQNGSFTIHFRGDSILVTRYAYLDNGNLSPAFVAIDEPGTKIKINSVAFVEGRDRAGKPRYFNPVQSFNEMVWAERVYDAEGITIYYMKVGDASMPTKYKPRHHQYTKNGRGLRTLTPGNLLADIGNNRDAMNYITRGHNIGKLQAALWAVGGSIFLGSFIYEVSFNPESEPLTPTLWLGAGVVALPWFLQASRRNNYIKALRAYRDSPD
jgi:hypothetical protein